MKAFYALQEGWEGVKKGGVDDLGARVSGDLANVVQKRQDDGGKLQVDARTVRSELGRFG